MEDCYTFDPAADVLDQLILAYGLRQVLIALADLCRERAIPILDPMPVHDRKWENRARILRATAERQAFKE